MPLTHNNEPPVFLAKLPAHPHFSVKFVESVSKHFEGIDNVSINYTDTPDMRLRKHTNSGRGFINAATIKWQSRRERFLISTALKVHEFKQFNLYLDHIQNNCLPSILIVDSTLFNKQQADILKLLEYAAITRDHPNHG